MSGRLTVVGTPIGNLGDLSPRAVEALTAADVVACEDTRRTGRLLAAAGVGHRELVVVNDHTEDAACGRLVGRARAGAHIALVSDAGMPAVSDPGQRLVAAFVAEDLPVSVVPGPTALSAALAGSGLASGRFVFEGFLPRKGSGRHDRLAEVAAETRTVVIYEAPHRVARTLGDLVEVCGPDRQVVLAHEVTKLHEEWFRGTLAGAVDFVDAGVKGELVLVLAGADRPEPPTDDELRRDPIGSVHGSVPRRDTVAIVVERFGVAKRRVYDLALDEG